MRQPTAIIAVVLLLSGVALSQKVPTGQPEQQSFDIAHGRPVVKHAVPLSDAELAALKQAPLEEVSRGGFVSKEHSGPPLIPNLTREGLAAAVVHLNGPTERDLVVIGSARRYVRHVSSDHPLTKQELADFDSFPIWVIREEHGKPKVVLAVFTRWLEIVSSEDHGLAGIEVSGLAMGSLITFLHFDGDKYVYWGEKSD